MARHPAYKKSTLVSKAAMASRLIVTASTTISNEMLTRANTFTTTTQPNAKPMTFTPAAHGRIRKVHTFTEGAAGLSAKTVGQVSKYAQNFGATLARRGEKQRAEKGPDYKPGLLNKSMIAFSTIADGIDHAGRTLLTSSSQAATTVVGHKWGAEAGDVTRSIGGGVKNVGLVYIDASGVSRKAIVKSVAKGMVVGKMRGGGDLIVGGGDGGQTLQNQNTEALTWKEREAKEGRYTDDAEMMSGGRDTPEQIGYSRAAPPAYATGPGESLEGQRAYPSDSKKPQYK
jgi:spartin